MTYDLYPSAELAALRARFTDYQVCAFHDHHGRPYLCAVLSPEHLGSSLPVLVTATSPDALGERLAAVHDPHASKEAVPAVRNSSTRRGGPGQETVADDVPASPPRDADADLTRRLRDALYTLKDRGLLPHWQPAQDLLPASRPVPAQRPPAVGTDRD